MSRPYFHSSIHDLESLFARSSDDKDVLRALKYELNHRSTHRAQSLAKQVERALAKPPQAKVPPRPKELARQVHSHRKDLRFRQEIQAFIERQAPQYQEEFTQELSRLEEEQQRRYQEVMAGFQRRSQRSVVTNPQEEGHRAVEGGSAEPKETRGEGSTRAALVGEQSTVVPTPARMTKARALGTRRSGDGGQPSSNAGSVPVSGGTGVPEKDSFDWSNVLAAAAAITFWGWWVVLAYPAVLLLFAAILLLVVRSEFQTLKATPYKRTAKEWAKGEERRWRERALQDRTRLLSISAYDFEAAVARIYENLGYHVTPTPASNDEGRDLVLKARGGEIILVECKQFAPKRKVGRPHLQKLHSAMMTEAHRGGQVPGGIVVTTGGFSNPARLFAKEHGIELVDGMGLTELMSKAHGPKGPNDLGKDLQAMCPVCGALTRLPPVVPLNEIEQPCGMGCGGSVRHPRERILFGRTLQ